MQALVFENIRTPVVKNVPIPGIGLHDVLIQVKAAGTCGTDVHIYEGEYFAEFPIIPGHEFSGVSVIHFGVCRVDRTKCASNCKIENETCQKKS